MKPTGARRPALLALGCCAALLAGCGDRTGQAAAPPPVSAEPAVKGLSVIFPDGSAQLGSFESQAAQPAQVVVHRLTGRLVWNEERTVRVYSAFAGRVEEIRVKPGDRVGAGQTLAVVDSPDFGQAQAEASRAAADFEVAKRNLDRVRDLYAGGVAAEKDLHGAEADFRRAQAELERVAARKRLYGGGDAVDQRYVLKAPVAGVVIEKNINPGQEVRPDQMTSGAPALFIVTDPTRLWVQLDATEQDLAFLHPGLPVRLSTPAYPELTFPARIEQVSDYIDPATRMIRVRASVPNPERRLKAEMFVRGEIEGEPGAGALVPPQAVFLVGNRDFVFVQEAKGRFVRAEIARDGEAGGKVVVRAGLQPGQRVVTRGALLLEQILESGNDARS